MWIKELKRRTIELKVETFVFYFAALDPRTPCYVKVFIAGIVAFAFSPIDPLPDFLPVIG